MFKWIKAFGLAALLALPFAAPVGAAVVTNTTDQLFNAVGETSSSLTAAAGADITVFVAGTYAAGNAVWLQKEVGSPGSGAWENFMLVTNGTANAKINTSAKNGTSTQNYRLLMTATGTGNVIAYLTDHWVSPRQTWARADYMEHYDEFIDQDSSATVVTAAKYSTEVSDSGGSLIASVSAGANEGALTITSGTTSNDGACFSVLTVASFGSDISLGWSMFEARLQSADDTDGIVSMGWSDQVCADTTDTIPVSDVDSGVVSQVDGESESLAILTRQDEATDVDGWIPVTAIADTEGANALEVSVGSQADAVYQVLRVEINSGGDAFFYIDGALVWAEPLAVTATAVLSPIIHSMESALNTGANITLVDYIWYVTPRPATSY